MTSASRRPSCGRRAIHRSGRSGRHGADGHTTPGAGGGLITIRWEGPDKFVREMIDDALDKLFFDLTMTGKVQAADTQIEFTWPAC